VVASSFVVPGGVCIAVVGVIFKAFSLSACCIGLIVHFAVSAFVHLESISSSASLSTTAMITTPGV